MYASPPTGHQGHHQTAAADHAGLDPALDAGHIGSPKANTMKSGRCSATVYRAAARRGRGDLVTAHGLQTMKLHH